MRHGRAAAAAALALLALPGAVTAQLSPPPAASHILVVVSGNPVTLMDYTSTGTLMNSVSLPGCDLTTGANQAYGSNSADGGFAVMTCGTTSTNNDVRQIVSIKYDGTIDLSTSYQSYRDAYAPRGTASVDGSSYWAADGACRAGSESRSSCYCAGGSAVAVTASAQPPDAPNPTA